MFFRNLVLIIIFWYKKIKIVLEKKKIIINIKIRNNLFNFESFIIGEIDNNNGEEFIEYFFFFMMVEFLIKYIRYGGC